MAARPPNCQDKAMEKDKAERLAEALRENLRKRKAQSRALADQAHGKSDGDHHGEDDA